MSTSHSFRKAFDSLQGRNYVVTGGGQGIGFTIAKAIAEFGGNVAFVDLRQSPVQEYNQLASEFKVRTEYYQCDVSSEESLMTTFEKVIKDFGQIHGLVTSAGIAIDKPFVEQTWQEAEKIQQVNVSAIFHRLILHETDSSTGPGNILRDSISSQTNDPPRDWREHRPHCFHHSARRSPWFPDGSVQCLKGRRTYDVQSTCGRACAKGDPRKLHLAWFYRFRANEDCEGW